MHKIKQIKQDQTTQIQSKRYGINMRAFNRNWIITKEESRENILW